LSPPVGVQMAVKGGDPSVPYASLIVAARSTKGLGALTFMLSGTIEASGVGYGVL